MVTFDYLPEFERRAKTLAKRYRSFVDDYHTFLDELERNPFSGTPLGGNTYMHRMAIAAKGKGKSGGARVITYNVQQSDTDVTITLMSIYDKSEISNVSDAYLRQLVKEMRAEVGLVPVDERGDRGRGDFSSTVPDFVNIILFLLFGAYFTADVVSLSVEWEYSNYTKSYRL